MVRRISGDAELAEELGMRTGDDVGGNKLANTAGGFGSGINSGFHAAES